MTPTTEQVELKPCPFCGNENIAYSYCGTGTYEIYSTDGGCLFCKQGILVDHGGIVSTDSNVVINAWNTRPQPTDGKLELKQRIRVGLIQIFKPDPLTSPIPHWKDILDLLDSVIPDSPTPTTAGLKELDKTDLLELLFKWNAWHDRKHPTEEVIRLRDEIVAKYGQKQMPSEETIKHIIWEHGYGYEKSEQLAACARKILATIKGGSHD